MLFYLQLFGSTYSNKGGCPVVIVRTVEDFYKKNHDELIKFLKYKTGIRDEETINDTMQEFYLRLSGGQILQSFDPNQVRPGTEEKVFQHYICNAFCWLLPLIKKRQNKPQHKGFSTVTIQSSRNSREEREIDVWEALGGRDGKGYSVSVANGFYTDQVDAAGLYEYESFIGSFCSYIDKTEKAKKSTKIKGYVKYRLQGLQGKDIADLLGVSDSSVTSIKNSAYRKLKQWNKECLESC